MLQKNEYFRDVLYELIDLMTPSNQCLKTLQDFCVIAEK